MQGTRITFKTKEDAMHFAEKQGEYSFMNVYCILLKYLGRMGLLCVCFERIFVFYSD